MAWYMDERALAPVFRNRLQTSHRSSWCRDHRGSAGLRPLSGIVGILTEALRASRDSARPLVPDSVLKGWAEEQADVVPKLWSKPEQQSACAQYIRLCGGNTKNLPIAIYRGVWVSAVEIAGMSSFSDEAVLVDHMTIDFNLQSLKSYSLEDTVFVTTASGIPGLLSSGPWQNDVGWPGESIQIS